MIKKINEIIRMCQVFDPEAQTRRAIPHRVWVKMRGFNTAGFTLFETLIAIAIFGVIGIISMDLLTRTFEGNTKAKLISKIKQNGQVAINTIDETIRDADSVVCVGKYLPGDTDDTILVISKSGINSRFILRTETDTSGYISLDYPTAVVPGNTDELCEPTATDPIFVDPDDSANRVFLTDKSVNTGVSLKAGQFAYTQVEGGKDLVEISFDLGPALNMSSTFSNSLPNVPFKTTIQLFSL